MQSCPEVCIDQDGGILLLVAGSAYISLHLRQYLFLLAAPSQGYIINILAVGDLVDVKGSHHDRWQLMVQEYIVCIEMFFIAVFNIWAWSAEPYLFDETVL